MITLAPMNEDDYQAYLARSIPEYAADKVRAGNWSEAEALERSRLEYEQILPEGIHTPGHFVGKLLDEAGQAVGYLWYNRLEKKPDTAFIYDFEIYTPYRRRGYASQALAALELHARAQGIRRLELHVFGDNTAARALYMKSGFFETNVNMAKNIDA